MAGARRPLPTGWKELRSEHGFPFYTHEAKGVVQWEHPLDQAASSWTRRFTAAGHTYYYNPVIAETRWGDGSEWVRSADDRGLPVFFNLLTRETTCTEPPEVRTGSHLTKLSCFRASVWRLACCGRYFLSVGLERAWRAMRSNWVSLPSVLAPFAGTMQVSVL